MVRSLKFAGMFAVLCSAVMVAETASAQIALPQKSQAAKVSMTVGVTDIEVVYSSPAARGRKIWGELVPFGKVWRTGANAATLITFSTDVHFAGARVEAGTYSVFSVPGPKRWQMILNRKTGMSGNQHDPASDVVKLDIVPEKVPARERMTFILSDSTDTSVNLDLEWAGLRVRVPIKADTTALAGANVDAALEDAWRPHYQAGRYILEATGNAAKAVEYLDTSIAIKPTWWASWYKALAHEKLGQPAKAVAAAKQAQSLGKGDRVYDNFYKGTIEQGIARWSK